MPACANCARELRPEWRFCIYCGTPTGTTSGRSEAPAVSAGPEQISAASTVLVAPPAASASAPPAPTAPAAAAPAAAPTSTGTWSRERIRTPRLNTLAVVALVLGCLVSPLAALFGHIALVQIAGSRERGRIPALIAVVLGYASLALIVGLVVAYLVNNA